MSLLLGFLTFFLVINCLFLMLLILIQLPKKEAGAGVAFGGAATDALFGAGSGNVLTKVTKYCAAVFLGLSVMISSLNSHRAAGTNRKMEEELQKKASAPIALLPTAVPTNAAAQSAAARTANNPLLMPTNIAAERAPAAPAK